MNCYGRMNDAELDKSLIPRDRERTSAHRLTSQRIREPALVQTDTPLLERAVSLLTSVYVLTGSIVKENDHRPWTDTAVLRLRN